MTEMMIRSPEVDKERNPFRIKRTRKRDSPVWADALRIEHDVFKRAGYIQGPDELEEEYIPYTNSEMVAIYRDGEVVGEIRIINYDPEVGFKTVNDIKRQRLQVDSEGQKLIDTIDPNMMFEVGTIGLDKSYRSTPDDTIHPVTQLYGVIYTYALENNKPYVIASYDEAYLQRYEGLYGASMIRLGPATEYMGSPTVPVLVNMKMMKEYFTQAGLGEFEDALLTAGRSVERDD